MSNKRQKVEASKVLAPQGLSLYDLKEDLGTQSPGTFFGNRIVAVQASPDQACVFIAAGQGVHAVRADLSKGDKGAGKEGVVLPRRSQLKAPPQHCPALHAQAEIQSLSLAQMGQRTALVSMDAYGRGLMSVASSSSLASGDGFPGASFEQSRQSSLKNGGNSQDGGNCVGSGDSNSSTTTNSSSSILGSGVPTFVLTPPGRVEAGWSGACMRELPNAGGEIATTTACHFGQCLNFYQGDRLIRAAHTLHPPSALTFLPRGDWGQGELDLVACAEGHQVSLWDVRQGSRGGLVLRTSVAPGGSPVFDLAWCKAQGGLLGAAGAERAVTLLEPRKGFGIVHKWSGCAKYTIHHLDFSGIDPHWAYVAGLDSEVVCGRWDGGGAACSGNSNSTTGGHGRAVGPKKESKENEEDGGHGDAAHPRAGTGNIKFRGPARWSGMSLTAQSANGDEDAGHDYLVAATQMHHLFLLDVAAQ